MRQIRNLVAFAFGVVLITFPMLVFADEYSARFGWYNTKQAATNVETPNEACLVALYMSSDYPGTYTDARRVGTTSSCEWQHSGGWVGAGTGGGTISTRYYCPYGGSLSDTICVQAPACPEGQVRDTSGQCVAPPNPCEDYAGKYLQSNGYWNSSMGTPVYIEGTGDPDGVQCKNGCSVTLERDFLAKGDGTWWASGYYVGTGATCTAEAPPEPISLPEEGPESKCLKAGLGYGTVNGTVVCTSPPLEKTETKKIVETDATSGEVKETTVTKTTNSTTNTSTTTTTTVTKDSSGNVISTTGGTTTGSGGTGSGAEGGAGFSGPGGELYEKGERTIADSLQDFRGTVSGSPVMSAVTGFFTVGNIGGTCPVFTVPATDWNPPIPYDAHCGWGSYFEWAKWAVLIAASWVAFRWAFL